MTARKTPTPAAGAPASASARRRPLAWAAGLGVGVALAALLLLQAGGREAQERERALVAKAGQQAPAARASFDSERAFALLKKQVEFGPRVPNLVSHVACRDYLVNTLKGYADSVERQDFTQTVRGQALKMSNVVARWKGKGGKNGVLLCAHWDTRPSADYERNPQRARTPIPGANDGASGVAVLLELARLFKQSPPPVPVMLVLFDGEDFGPGTNHMFLGSRHFAANLPTDVPKRGVLIDMIGDRDLEIPQEANSLLQARDVMNEVYDIAHAQGYEKHFPRRFAGAIEDDHIPLQQKGLKVIDLIDFNYGPNHSWWHTLEDTPDKCSPASLKVVGDVLLEWTHRQK